MHAHFTVGQCAALVSRLAVLAFVFNDVSISGVAGRGQCGSAGHAKTHMEMRIPLPKFCFVQCTLDVLARGMRLKSQHWVT